MCNWYRDVDTEPCAPSVATIDLWWGSVKSNLMASERYVDKKDQFMAVLLPRHSPRNHGKLLLKLDFKSGSKYFIM